MTCNVASTYQVLAFDIRTLAGRRRQREGGELLRRECPSEESCREYGPYLVGNLGPEGAADDSDDGGSWRWPPIR